MNSLVTTNLLAKSAFSECSIKILESFPILSQKITKPADNQRVLNNQGAQNKTTLPLVELSNIYFSADAPDQIILEAAPGEAMLAKGEYGRTGIFPRFFMPNIAVLVIFIVMLKGKIFSKTNSLFGIVGRCLLFL